jgi:hypothetical protein
VALATPLETVVRPTGRELVAWPRAMGGWAELVEG